MLYEYHGMSNEKACHQCAFLPHKVILSLTKSGCPKLYTGCVRWGKKPAPQTQAMGNVPVRAPQQQTLRGDWEQVAYLGGAPITHPQGSRRVRHGRTGTQQRTWPCQSHWGSLEGCISALSPALVEVSVGQGGHPTTFRLHLAGLAGRDAVPGLGARLGEGKRDGVSPASVCWGPTQPYEWDNDPAREACC